MVCAIADAAKTAAPNTIAAIAFLFIGNLLFALPIITWLTQVAVHWSLHRVAIPILILASCGFAQNTAPPPSPASNPDLQAVRQLIESERIGDAEKAVRQYLLNNTDSAAAHYLLAYILFRAQDPKRSLAEYTVAARYRTPNAFDLEIVGSNYVLLGDYTDADKWFTKAVEWNPANVRVRYYLGRAKYNENRFAEAIAVFLECLKLDPKNVKAADNLALSYEGLGRADDALKTYRDAISWDSEAQSHNPQPYLDFGTFLVSQDRASEAVAYLEKAVAFSPVDPVAHRQLGKAYLHADRLEDARKQLETASALDPQNGPTHFILAQVYRRLGMVDKAHVENERYAEQKK